MSQLIDGWEEMDLPSVVNDLTRLYSGYGAHMSADGLEDVAREVKYYSERISFMFGNHVPFVTFSFRPQKGEMLIAFPLHNELEDHSVRTCRRNEASLADCCKIGSSFVEAFERLVLPAVPHAAETLK